MNKTTKIFLLMAAFIIMLPIELYAQNIRVTGVVRGNNGERIPGVSVTDVGNQRVLGITDEDGKYSVILAPNATPCAWFPALHAMIPRDFSSSLS